MKNDILTICEHVVAGALTGVYQGLLVLGVIWLGLRVLRRTNAATRHAVWFAALLLLGGLLVAHSWRNLKGVASEAAKPHVQSVSLATAMRLPDPGVQSGVEATELAAQQPGGEPPSLAAPIPLEPQIGPMPQQPVGSVIADASQPLAANTQVFEPAREVADTPVLAAADQERVPSAESVARTAGVPGWSLFLTAINPVSWDLGAGLKIPRLLSVILLAVWFAMALLRLCFLLLQLVRIRKLKAQSHQAGQELNGVFESLRRKLGVRRNVVLKVSGEYASPIVLGFVHPVILLPAETAPEEIEPVLAHELAHVRRRDDWANLYQQVIQAAFFFHPGICWICKRLSLEREIACDDQVLQQSRQPRAYALLLANLAGRMQGRPPLLAPGASAHQSQLQQRITMILDTTRNSSPRLAKTRLGFIVSAAALMVMGAVSFAPRIMLAQGEPPPVPAPPDVAPPPAVPRAALPVVPPRPTAITPGPDLSGLAQAELPDSPGPKDVHPGLKLKARPLRSLDALDPVHPPAIPHAPTIAHPAPPAAPAIGARHGPMIAAGPPAPARVGNAPRAPGADASIEERLARVERMLESLMGDKKIKEGEFHLKWPEGKYDLKGPARFHEQNQLIDPKEIEKIKEHARREAARATEEVRRATREMEKARVDQKRQARGQVKEASERQIEALRKQMEHLDRQKEELGRQIERLERDREKLKEQDGEDEEDFGDLNFELEESNEGEAKEECLTKEPACL